MQKSSTSVLRRSQRIQWLAICAVLLLHPPLHGDDSPGASPRPGSNWAVLIHGGMVPPESSLPEEETREMRRAMNEALQAASALLDDGLPAIDAVTAAIVILEDSPYFNAGKGAVFTADGRNELDASIMQGVDLDAGAVASATRIKNPILAARAVMENSQHVLIASEGANQFAQQAQLTIVDPGYFRTDFMWDVYQRAKSAKVSVHPAIKHHPYGTVGAVALDTQGHLVAGTSTGGGTLKLPGRIGDSPIIGAGTYADDESCAVSATGHGEFFIRFTVARSICAEVERGDVSLEQAVTRVLQGRMKLAGGLGGVIALNRGGEWVVDANTDGYGVLYGKADSAGDQKVVFPVGAGAQ